MSNVSITKSENLVRESEYPYNILYCVYEAKTDEAKHMIYNIFSDADYLLLERLNLILKNFHFRDAEIFTQHFKYNKKFRELADIYKISRSRAQQIVANIIEHIRKKYRNCLINEQSVYDLFMKLNPKLETAKDLVQFSNKSLIYELERRRLDSGSTKLGFTLLEDLEFSIRTFNCLIRYIKRQKGWEYEVTLRDLLTISDYEYTHEIRNLGPKSYNEIKDKMKELGFEMVYERDDPKAAYFKLVNFIE